MGVCDVTNEQWRRAWAKANEADYMFKRMEAQRNICSTQYWSRVDHETPVSVFAVLSNAEDGGRTGGLACAPVSGTALAVWSEGKQRPLCEWARAVKEILIHGKSGCYPFGPQGCRVRNIEEYAWTQEHHDAWERGFAKGLAVFNCDGPIPIRDG